MFPMPLGSYVQMRVVALLELEDQNGPNHKVIGVPDEEPRLLEYQVHPRFTCFTRTKVQALTLRRQRKSLSLLTYADVC